jgi:hypothetical protein
LLTQRILQTWNAYSLIERTKIIENLWGIQVSNNTLWKFYRQNNIKLRTGKAVYRAEMRRTAEIVNKRKIFAAILATLVHLGRPLIYVDETTFNTWQLK